MNVPKKENTSGLHLFALFMRHMFTKTLKTNIFYLDILDLVNEISVRMQHKEDPYLHYKDAGQKQIRTRIFTPKFSKENRDGKLNYGFRKSFHMLIDGTPVNCCHFHALRMGHAQ